MGASFSYRFCLSLPILAIPRTHTETPGALLTRSVGSLHADCWMTVEPRTGMMVAEHPTVLRGRQRGGVERGGAVCSRDLGTEVRL